MNPAIDRNKCSNTTPTKNLVRDLLWALGGTGAGMRIGWDPLRRGGTGGGAMLVW